MAAAMQAHRYDLHISFIPWRCIVICAIALLITTMIVTLAALSICSCAALIKNIRNAITQPDPSNAGLIALMDEMFAGMTWRRRNETAKAITEAVEHKQLRPLDVQFA